MSRPNQIDLFQIAFWFCMTDRKFVLSHRPEKIKFDENNPVFLHSLKHNDLSVGDRVNLEISMPWPMPPGLKTNLPYHKNCYIAGFFELKGKMNNCIRQTSAIFCLLASETASKENLFTTTLECSTGVRTIMKNPKEQYSPALLFWADGLVKHSTKNQK